MESPFLLLRKTIFSYLITIAYNIPKTRFSLSYKYFSDRFRCFRVSNTAESRINTRFIQDKAESKLSTNLNLKTKQ